MILTDAGRSLHDLHMAITATEFPRSRSLLPLQAREEDLERRVRL